MECLGRGQLSCRVHARKSASHLSPRLLEGELKIESFIAHQPMLHDHSPSYTYD